MKIRSDNDPDVGVRSSGTSIGGVAPSSGTGIGMRGGLVWLLIGIATAVSAGCSDPECRGPGRYEAGKEGSYRPCCAGLTEVPYSSPAYQGGADRTPVCWMPPLRVYACVQGTCGDGICEVGEAPACGCVADCPSARFAAQDASPAF